VGVVGGGRCRLGALYLVLAPPVTGPKDCGEFTLVLTFGGAAHPTGYPVYVVLGHLFVHALHTLGATWAYAANAWSAAGGAVALALYHALAVRLVPPGARLGRFGRFALGLVPVLLLGTNPVWLLDAILVEVYTWHLRGCAARRSSRSPRCARSRRARAVGGAAAGRGRDRLGTAVRARRWRTTPPRRSQSWR